MGNFDVLGLGQCTFDRMGIVPALPPPDEKREIEAEHEQVGGPIATALLALAGWGRRCAVAGVIGDDPEGEAILRGLGGVDASRLLVRKGARSQRAFVAVERGTGRRTIYWRRPTGLPPDPLEIVTPEARVFLSDGLYAEASVACARASKMVVVDAGTLREGTLALLPLAHVFVASEVFARDFAGDPRAAVRKIREAGALVAGVTLGARGYVASFGDTWLERPAHPANAVDTTGCGDIFHAGLVEGFLSGRPWERSFDFAAWAAARAAERLGNRAPGRSGYPEAG
jgi:sulfofructose kinase